MKKFFKPLLTVVFVVMFSLSACEKAPGELPKVEYPDDPPPIQQPNDPPQQDLTFETALDAYNFGNNYFEKTATNYETTYHGLVEPQGLGAVAGTQKAYTRRYLSSSGDFIYDSANYSGKGMDVSFSFISAQKGGESNIYYKKIKGKDQITESGDVLLSDYSGLNLSSLESVSQTDFKSACGFNPRELANYVVNSNTISSVEFFNKGGEEDEFAFSFKFKLNSSAHVNYKNQVKYFSGYNYSKFSYLTLEFGMDKYGRIRKVVTSEEYSVSVPLLGDQKTKLESVLYITYGKNPTINFDNFTATYAD